MPKNTKVDRNYEAIKKSGVPAGEAAAIAQKQTGESLKTGKPPKSAPKGK